MPFYAEDLFDRPQKPVQEVELVRHRWYRSCDRLHEKLAALGVPHEIDFTTRAGGHTWDYFDALAERIERFIHAGLEYESRRLL